MEKEVVEILAYFRENASDLKKLGKQWGLSNSEISDCIERAMSADLKNSSFDTTPSSSTRLKFAARKSWPRLKICLSILGVLMVLIVGAGFVMENKQIEHRFIQLVQPLVYPFLRSFRLAAAPLHHMFNFYDYFLEECVIYNPLYDKDSVLGDHACENCKTITTVMQLTATDLQKDSFPDLAFFQPVVAKGVGPIVSLETFQRVLSRNPFIKQPLFGIKTNLAWATHVEDLFGEDVAEKFALQPDFYFVWFSKQTTTSQIMKKIFPKPELLGPKSEIAVRKTIFILGPKSKTFELLRSPISSFNWYVQGWGLKQVDLTPTDLCETECSPITMNLTAGDILTYNCDIYTVGIKPAGEDISISFLGHFVPIQASEEKEKEQKYSKKKSNEKEGAQTDTKEMSEEKERVQTDTKEMSEEKEKVQADTKEMSDEKERVQTDTKEMSEEKERVQTDTKEMSEEKEKAQAQNK